MESEVAVELELEQENKSELERAGLLGVAFWAIRLCVCWLLSLKMLLVGLSGLCKMSSFRLSRSLKEREDDERMCRGLREQARRYSTRRSLECNTVGVLDAALNWRKSWNSALCVWIVLARVNE